MDTSARDLVEHIGRGQLAQAAACVRGRGAPVRRAQVRVKTRIDSRTLQQRRYATRCRRRTSIIGARRPWGCLAFSHVFTHEILPSAARREASPHAAEVRCGTDLGLQRGLRDPGPENPGVRRSERLGGRSLGRCCGIRHPCAIGGGGAGRSGEDSREVQQDAVVTWTRPIWTGRSSPGPTR